MNEITEKDAGDVPLRIPKTELNLNQLSFFYPKTVILNFIIFNLIYRNVLDL